MTIKKLTLLCFLAFSAVNVQASSGFPQKIRLCFSVTKNDTTIPFVAGFVSSDFFDMGSWTRPIYRNTMECVEHTYNHGPKNIYLRVRTANLVDVSRVIIIPDAACGMQPTNVGNATTPYIRATHANETWNYQLDPITIGGNLPAFQLSCEHTSA